MRERVLRSCSLAALLLSVGAALTSSAAAQTNQSQIAGTITDGSGGALPGVTVTLTSPALQVGQLVQVSGTGGEYRFSELPAGLYGLRYELEGFTTLIREEIRLTTGFVARVDVSMALGGLRETITVVGGAPLVDASSTHGGTVVDAAVLATAPTSLTMQDVYLISGGVTAAVPPTNGSGGVRALATLFAPITYGQQTAWGGYQLFDGVLTYSNQVPDLSAIDEIDVRTYGNTAEVCCPGYASVVVLKSGGNDFHGSVREYYQNKRFQANNVDAALRAQGLSRGQIKYYNDVSADLGGRILRNKLWFYGAFHDQRNDAQHAGFSRETGPDGLWGTTDDIPATAVTAQVAQTIKLSYQATNRHKFVGMYHKNNLIEEASRTGSGGFRFTPFESTSDYSQPYPSSKIEWQGAFSDRLFVSAVGATTQFAAHRNPQPCCAERVSTFDLATQQETGAFWNALKGTRSAIRYQGSANVTYLPRGSLLGRHELRFGGAILPERNEVDYPFNLNGDYRLVFNNGVATQFWTVNTPLSGYGWTQKTYGYLTDSWEPLRRLTVNVGIRFDRFNVWVPEQSREPGPWPSLAPLQITRLDVADWKTIAPRGAIAYDLFGTGRTVLKATLGRYYHDYGYGYVNQFNPNASQQTTQYRWTDPTGCRCYVPGAVNLDPNGPDVLAVVGAASPLVNPDLDLVFTDEATTSLEHELGAGVSLRTLYIYKQQNDTQWTINTLRPFDSWNQVLSRQDPGPDGRVGTGDDGAVLTIYDFDPALRGSRFVANTTVNATDRRDDFHNLELSMRKRDDNDWFAFTTLLFTKNHKWRTYAVQSPNDNLFPVNNTWTWSYRLSAGYHLPFQSLVSMVYQADNGFVGARTANFSAPNSGNLALPVEAPRVIGPARHVFNVRGSKELSVGRHRLSLDVDVFNLFNTNVGWLYNVVSGPSYGYVTDLAEPRVARFGVVYRF